MSSNLHPIFQQALKPFAPAVHMLIEAPKCPRGLVQFEYNADSLVPLICHLEYEAAEAGDDINPSWPAQMHLDAAYIGAIDVVKALTVMQIRAIEEAALGEQA